MSVVEGIGYCLSMNGVTVSPSRQDQYYTDPLVEFMGNDYIRLSYEQVEAARLALIDRRISRHM